MESLFVPYEFLFLFVISVLIASYIQGVTGFAMAMLLVAVLGSARVLDIGVLTATVSLLTLVNIGMSLHGHYHLIQGRVIKWLLLGQIPAVFLGVWLLDLLSVSALALFELLLGVFIVLGCLAMLVKPRLRDNVSSSLSCLVAGLSGGLLGGLFAASGPVMGWFCYRQPLAIVEIRATLLSFFAISTLLRTGIVGVNGGLTQHVWLYFICGVPIVLLGTWLARRFPPVMEEKTLRQCVFGVMMALGLWLIISSTFGGAFEGQYT